MDAYYILDVITFLSILISVLSTFWIYLTHKKEEMQAMLFLRYEYVRKSILAFYAAIAIYIVSNAVVNLGLTMPPIYMAIINLVVLALLVVTSYYFWPQRLRSERL